MAKVASQVWAVIDEHGNVCITPGGSSTRPKLMCYPTEGKAKAALRWAPRAVNPRVVLLHEAHIWEYRNG